MKEPSAMQIGLFVFPNVQQLDLTGPYEVFASWPGARVRFVAKTLHPVTSSTGLKLIPDVTFDDCPQLDLCVPGGAGASRGGESDIHPRDQQ
jgi:cyclohexyl-isocyanide hydratase